MKSKFNIPKYILYDTDETLKDKDLDIFDFNLLTNHIYNFLNKSSVRCINDYHIPLFFKARFITGNKFGVSIRKYEK
jgi:hypothetical protein